MMLVRYFASLREQLGVSEETVSLPVSTVQELIDVLAQRGALWQELLQDNRRLQIAVNQDMARRTSALSADDEVAFFPPVTGG
jgi:molybdopterin synthase sulfur carrier subunit